jgi:integrase
MAGTWERTRTPGIYRQDGARGTKYKATYRDSAGRLRSKTFVRVKDAEFFLADVHVKKTTGSLLDAAAGKMLFRDFWQHFCETSPHLKPSTRELYDMQARLYLLPAFGDLRLSSISKADVRKFVADLSCEGKGAATISGAQRLLHRLLALAVEEDRIVRNPAHGVKVPQGGRREPRFLTGEEVAAVGREVPDRYRALVYTLAYGGLRIGEATALRVRSVDFKAGTIRVVENAPEIGGRKLLGQSTKTGRGVRTVDIPAALGDLLREHLTKHGTPLDPDSLVFTNRRGGPVLQSNFRQVVFQPAARRAEVVPVPTVHDLRHTAASLFAKAGLTLQEAADQLGHGSTTMTARYSHIFPEHRQAKIAKLEVVA